MVDVRFVLQLIQAVVLVLAGREWVERGGRIGAHWWMALALSTALALVPLEEEWTLRYAVVLAGVALCVASAVLVFAVTRAMWEEKEGKGRHRVAVVGAVGLVALLSWIGVPRIVLVFGAFWALCFALRSSDARTAGEDLAWAVLWSVLCFPLAVIGSATVMLVLSVVTDLVGLSHETVSPVIYWGVLYGPQGLTYHFFQNRQRRRHVLPA